MTLLPILYSHQFSFLFAGLLGCVAIYYVLVIGVKEGAISKLLVGLGSMSYSLYLVHIPLFILLASVAGLAGLDHFHSPWLHYIFVIAVLPVAYLFYVLFEKTSLALLQRHKERQRVKKLEAATQNQYTLSNAEHH